MRSWPCTRLGQAAVPARCPRHQGASASQSPRDCHSWWRAVYGPNGLPGHSWWNAFRRRHGLKPASASFMTRSAAQTLKPEALDGFYTLLFGVLDEYKVPTELIW